MSRGNNYYILTYEIFAVAGCAMSHHEVAYSVGLNLIYQAENTGGTYIAMGI